MKRSKSSKQWLKQHFSDPYVKKARQEGFRSRAAFKLAEIQERDKILKPGMRIVELGAAPGGWSQYVRDKIGDKGVVVAVDLLTMDPIAGVEFIQGDFQDPAILGQLMSIVGESKVDLVISDMAPNISGMKMVDQARMMNLAELALEFAKTVLVSKGAFLVKVFQGSGTEEYIRLLRQSFNQVLIRKPKASRSNSSEVYLLAKDFKL
jgi:23S rRNA (uridine2552-2'-O)-methyltransferase